MFNNYWFENEDPSREWDRQHRIRAARMAAAVHTFFPDICEFFVVNRMIRGCYEI